MSFTVYIDESGDCGIDKVRTNDKDGATPYLTLGAVFIKDSEIENLETCLQNLRSATKPQLHCNHLNHNQKLHFCTEATSLNITCFGVISRKETLDDYKNQIDNKKFYNKCATYLLECIGQYAREKNIDKKEIKLYFEKGNFAYEKLRNFISKCQKTPFQSRANNLKFIEPYNIYHKTKEEMPSLEIADLIAHSLYKIVDKNRANFGITEPRYFNILRPLFYSDPKNNILNYGLKPIHNINDLGLSKDEIEALNL